MGRRPSGTTDDTSSGVWSTDILNSFECPSTCRRTSSSSRLGASSCSCVTSTPPAASATDCEPCNDDYPMPEAAAHGDHEDTEGGLSRTAVWGLAHRSTRMPSIPDEMADTWDGE